MITGQIIFVVLSLISGVVMAIQGTWDIGSQAIICFGLIAMVGIPHGAIDHILIKDEKNTSDLKFYLFYLGMMGFFVLLWMTIPFLSLILFILVSAYHFGQSQFADITLSSVNLKRLLYLSWGMTVLSSLFLFNSESLLEIVGSYRDTALLSSFFEAQYQLTITIGCGLFSIGIMIAARAKKAIGIKRLWQELITLAVILIAFKALPLILAFTLYFCFIHSLKVLTEEFSHLKELGLAKSLRDFIILLTPFTGLSLFALGTLWLLQSYDILRISEFMLLLMLISMVTLPHSIVMEQFYIRRAENIKG